jgi:hypothetical protein
MSTDQTPCPLASNSSIIIILVVDLSTLRGTCTVPTKNKPGLELDPDFDPAQYYKYFVSKVMYFDLHVPPM